MAETIFKKGDKVKFTDEFGIEREGIVKECKYTDEFDNKDYAGKRERGHFVVVPSVQFFVVEKSLTLVEA